MTAFADRCRALNEDRGHLCVGIDPRPGSFPKEYGDADGFQRWCLDLVEATEAHAAAYKPNLAFFLAMGPPGLETLEATCKTASDTGALVILDGKFADIGSTAQAYAAFAADVAGADAVTLSPYLGTDVVAPFQERGVDAFVLARTTNPSGVKVQQGVMGRVIDLFSPLDVGFVAPGNAPDALSAVRQHTRDLPLLVPGIGAQGGTAEQAAKAAAGGPFLVSVSRGISQAEGTFPDIADEVAKRYADALTS